MEEGSAAAGGAGGEEEEEEEDIRVSWNPKAILTTYEVDNDSDSDSKMVSYPKRKPRDPAVVKLTKEKLLQRVLKDRPSRNIQVKRFEKHFRGGDPCDKREELISAFNNLMGLEKTIDRHDSMMDFFFRENGYDDPEDVELRQELVEEFNEARTKAKALMKYCGFKGMLRFGKILEDPSVSPRKKHKVRRVMNLFM